MTWSKNITNAINKEADKDDLRASLQAALLCMTKYHQGNRKSLSSKLYFPYYFFKCLNFMISRLCVWQKQALTINRCEDESLRFQFVSTLITKYIFQVLLVITNILASRCIVIQIVHA